MMWEQIHRYQILLAALLIVIGLLSNRHELVRLNDTHVAKFNRTTGNIEQVCSIQANTCEKWEQDRAFYERIRDEEREKANAL